MQDADLGARTRLCEVAAVEGSFAREAGQVPHRPRITLALQSERGVPATDEELRDSHLVQVRPHRQHVLGTDAV